MLTNTVIIVLLSVLSSGLIVFIFTRKWNEAHYGIYVERAKAKANAIEKESQLTLDLHKSNVEKELIDARVKYEEDYRVKKEEIQKSEESLKHRAKQELNDIEELKRKTQQAYDIVDSVIEEASKSKEKASKQVDETLRVLNNYTGFTEDEAKAYILKEVERKSRSDIAKIVRKAELEANKEAQEKANYFLAQATSRFAYEFVNDRLINKVTLDNDDLKGRIIGKDGRNIYTLENLLGVDIIIDETPNTIIVSSFNLYRRAIATRTIEILVEDGRVQPARIEDTYKKVSQEFEEKIYKQGQQVIMELGVDNIHTELIKLIGKLKYRSSFGQNALNHSLEVALFASTIAGELGGDAQLARRAGLLHDIGKALTNDKQGSHVDLGAEICRKYDEHDVVINSIYAHHDLEDARSIECAAVCAADVLSAARPGARRDAINSFTSRLENIEAIAYAKEGVLRAYAIDAGRELRIIVNAKIVDDNQTFLIAKEISEQIEKEVQYPGKIKVAVIRETRSVKYAL